MTTPHHLRAIVSLFPARALLAFLPAIALMPVHGTPAAAAPAADGPARIISADVQQVQGPLDRMFELCVGSGHASLGLRADWQRQLAWVHRECGFRYVRMHGLLSDDMGVYSEDKDGHPVYNWQYIDMVYDYLLRIGMKPFVELSFMPDALASGKQTIFWWHGNVTQPKSPKKWESLIRALVEHWTRRYGEAEVRTWYFEVWNEPNLKVFFDGTQADYFRLYAETARAIKSVCPDYRVGGPATAGNAWIPQFIDYCFKNHVPLDFISTHDYAVNKGYVDVDGNAGTILSPDPDAIWGNIRRSRAEIAASPMPHLPLHYTEWSTSYTPKDPIHDCYQSAAFILDKVRHSAGYAQSMSYWTFTDIFEEAGPRRRPFHGGFGLLNMQGIPKPAFYAFRFLHELGSQELKSSDPASYVCRNPSGGVQALFWDFSLPHPTPKENDQVYYLRDIPPAPRPPVDLRLTGLKPGTYELEVSKVGYRVNDAYGDYLKLGSPHDLSPAQVAFLKAHNNGTPILRTLVTVGADGAFARQFPMRANDVYLVRLSPL